MNDNDNEQRIADLRLLILEATITIAHHEAEAASHERRARDLIGQRANNLASLRALEHPEEAPF